MHLYLRHPPNCYSIQPKYELSNKWIDRLRIPSKCQHKAATDYLHSALCAIKSDPQQFLVASTCISSKWIPPGWSKHIMVLDCDGMQAMLAATQFLQTEKIGYLPIQSSDHHANGAHYWLVTNFIGNIWQVTKKMAEIPGIDERHRSLSQTYRHVHVRATPKLGSIPIFLDDDAILVPPVRKWYRELKTNYETHGARIQEALKLSTTFKSGKMLEAAADPSFVV